MASPAPFAYELKQELAIRKGANRSPC